MKHNTIHRRRTGYTYQPAYPNAADASYFTNRALNALTVIVSSLGFVSAMLFLVSLA